MITKIIAHRGDTSYGPENTLSAFRAALKNGARAIELDVHSTKDGILIVHHDYYLGNPDNGEGIIYERDYAYITTLHINNIEKIPTLEEVFSLIGNKLHYEIELKGLTEEFLVNVAALVKKYNLSSYIEFTSPIAYNLTRIKELEPSFKTGTFVAALPAWMDKKLGQKIAINNALLGNIDVLHCPLSLIDSDFIQTAHEEGLLIHAADCDTEVELQEAFNMNVDQLSTNKLSLAIDIRAQKRVILRIV
ncbi:MAG TPA: glycerophosphodiester phosphodiesterase [Candidatus Saccharimonadales bacterium]|jgi:glycerophosphoryl diester phosphodiesterase